MKIVHVLAPAHAGGLERVVHALAIGQQNRGHQVTVVPVATALPRGHSFVVPLERAGVPMRPVIAPARAYARERRAIRELLDELRPDVMHSHGYHTDVMAVGIARDAGVGTVSTAHGFTRGEFRNRVYEWLDRRAFRRFDGVACVSRLLADELIASGVRPARIRIIPNAWSQVAPPLTRANARAALGLPADVLVAGWVGRMTHEKGLDVLIDAAAALADHPSMICAIGDGPERAAQEARAASLGLEDKIRWPGMLLEASQYFSAFDVLVLSSRTEGVPMVVLEAMAQKVPLVVTAVGGIPDVVSPTEARLVPSESPVQLAGAIREALSDHRQSQQRAEAAWGRLSREFDESAWLAAYDSLYEMAASRGESARAP